MRYNIVNLRPSGLLCCVLYVAKVRAYDLSHPPAQSGDQIQVKVIQDI